MWHKLASKLKRRPLKLYHHWEGVIKPQILMYQNGVDHLDFRRILVDYFIEEGLLFRNEKNWSEIVNDKRFKGTTPNYLMRIYADLVGTVKKTYPGIEDDDITSEVLREHLDKRSRIQRKVKNHRRIIQDYLTIKNGL